MAHKTKDEDYRDISLQGTAPVSISSFATNKINTWDCNPLTLCKNLILLQFKKLSNVWFLFVSILELSIDRHYWCTIFLFSLVILINLLRESSRYYWTYKNDLKLNKRQVPVWNGTDFIDKYWEDLVVGEIILLHDNCIAPADILVLACGNQECECYVDTFEVLGERNLRVKESVKSIQGIINSNEVVKASQCLKKLNEIVKVSHPKKNFKKFQGKINIRSPKPELISYKNYIMRGEMIVNSGWIFAFVIYTGAETKVYINSQPNMKLSYFDKKMNLIVLAMLGLIAILITIQIILGATIDSNWSSSDNSKDLLLHSILVVHEIIPTSLFLCIEIARTLQAILIAKKYPGIKFNKGFMTEDLGQIEYILLDKTGTLTKNELEVKVCIIGDEYYWNDSAEETHDIEECESPRSESNLNTFIPSSKSSRLHFSSLKREVLKFSSINENIKYFLWCMSLCNHAYPDSETDFQAICEYDKVLAKCSQKLGLNMIIRTQSTTVIDINGVPSTFKILGDLPYSPEQKRSMILVSCPNFSGSILFAKGDKAEMLDLFDISGESKFLIEEYTLSRKLIGMRTLIFGYKILSNSKTEEFIADYKNARLSPINKTGKIESVFEKYQNNLSYLGIVGLEDALTEGAQDCIKTLEKAGIKFWLLSGDDEESSIRAGVGSSMFEENVRIIRMTDFKSEQDCIECMISHIQNCIYHDEVAEEEINEVSLVDSDHDTYNAKCKIKSEPMFFLSKDDLKLFHSTSDHPIKLKEQDHANPEFKRIMLPLVTNKIKPTVSLSKSFNHQAVYYVLSINGEALEYALKSHDSRRYFISLLFAAKSVLFHSLLPQQKRKIVKLLKSSFQFKPTVMTIGDGSDDIGMLQEAHVGVSLERSSCPDAENSSDVVIKDFWQLRDLVLYEGYNNYFRFSAMILLGFYSKSLMSFIKFFYNVFYSYSAFQLFSYDLELLYELLITTFPIIAIGIYEKRKTFGELIELPQLYCSGIYRTAFTWKKLAIVSFAGLSQGFIIVVLVCSATGEIMTKEGYTSSLDLLSFTLFIIMSVTFFLVCFLYTNTWNKYTIGCPLVVIIFSSILILLLTYDLIPNDHLIGISEMIGLSPLVWMSMIFIPLIMNITSHVARVTIFDYLKNNFNTYRDSKDFNIEPSVESRLKAYNNCLGSVYVNSYEWKEKNMDNTFDFNKYMLKFSSKFREKSYQETVSETNLVFYRTLMILKMLTMISFVLYRIYQLIDDIHPSWDWLSIIVPETAILLLCFTSYFIKYMKWIILFDYLIFNFQILSIGSSTYIGSSPPIVLVFFMLGFSQFWMEMQIFSLIYITTSFISITFYFNTQEFDEFSWITVSVEYMIFMIGIFFTSSLVSYNLDKTKRSEYIVTENVQIEVNKPLSILNLLLPASVSKRVKNGDRSIAEDQGIVSVIFCDMNNFDSIVANYSPQELTAFLDEVFGKFDKLCEQSGVSKIETVGKTYMACAGLGIFESEIDPNLTYVSHARRAIEFGFLVIKAAKSTLLKNGDELTFKIGINSGRVVAGVVGNHKPQFSLIGDTVNTSSRMCSTSTEPNAIQISSSTYSLLEDSDKQGLSFDRKTVWVKGKGDMDTFIVSIDPKADGSPAMDTLQVVCNSALLPTYSMNGQLSSTRVAEPSSASHIEKRRTLIASLDIHEAKELFHRANTETIENMKIFSLRCRESQKERQFRLETIENKLYVYYAALYIAAIVSFVALISQSIELNLSSDEGNIPAQMVISGIDIANFLLLIVLLKCYYMRRRFAWTMQCVYLIALCLHHVISLYGDEAYLNIEPVIGMYWILLMTHCSELFFHWILLITAIFVIPWMISLFYIEDQFNKILLVFVAWYIVILLYTLHHKEKSLRISYLLISTGKSEIEKTEKLLKNMMPPHVYQNLKDEKNITELIKDVTLIYADIVGFTAWSSRHAPEEIVRRLSDLFASFDKLCEDYHVYKVHTIGDCYVAMGYREDSRDPPKECQNMVKFASSMIEVIETVNEKYGSELNMRIGMHTGDVIGTMFGTNIVRYDIYGSDVLIANKMESNGEAGKIVMSEVTKELLETHKPGRYQFSHHKEVSLQSLDRTIQAYILLDFFDDLERGSSIDK